MEQKRTTEPLINRMPRVTRLGKRTNLTEEEAEESIETGKRQNRKSVGVAPSRYGRPPIKKGPKVKPQREDPEELIKKRRMGALKRRLANVRSNGA